ncbi:speckle targeted PIP5K1A-regulated poly(A) polymerase-like [Chelonus insularis]|uniref:speckle targeted PIP5K1A-regulated poly(A) polymerase-like n=1 Tax=Chelonus insularis TaxID=460826 RepID=UPI0015893E4E|nr:speckle targeted PIP5K1A-regulated poly(A) polymerase-like [Chelonus insularis]
MSKYCEICNLNFLDEYAFHGHLMGKKHSKKADLEKERKKKEQNSIFVSPVPQWVRPDDILKFFTQFGQIQNHQFGPRFFIIEFTSKEPVEYLLSKQIWMDKWLMKIQRRIIHNSNKRVQNKSNQSTSSEDNTEEKEEIEDVDLITYALDEETTFDGQLDRLLSLIQSDDSEVRARCDNVCASLDRVLSKIFPKCKAIRFGSTVTGLHLKTSDMDVFLDIGEPVKDDDDSNSETVNSKLGWTPKLIFREVKNVLYKNKYIFTRVIPIPMAKIPVIKFNHIPTNTDCDISFKHSFGVHNSQLIKHLLTLDPRVKPLMMIIKYWAKKLDITGTGKITNYSLIIAIIFYLQQPNLQILPTVYEIQSTCQPIFFNGWQINFNKKYKKNVTNNSTIPELIYGFFKFYADFMFYDMIINPLDGLMYQRTDTAKITSLGINIESLQLHKPACILDPIKFDHNIASGWSDRLLRDFQAYCTESVQICEESAKNQYNNLLSSLYDSNVKKQLKKCKTYYMTIPAGRFEKLGLPKNFEEDENIKDKKKYIEDHWFHMTTKLIRAVFERVLKFDVRVVNDVTNLKQMKTDEQFDVYSKKNDKIILLCKGKHCLNRGRKGMLSNLDVTLSPIDKESVISDKILETLQHNNDITLFKFTCLLEKQLNPLRVELKLTNARVKNNVFTEISVFMVSKIPKLIDKEFLHMAQYEKVA